MFAVACNGSAETPATTTDSTKVDSTVVAADSTATVDSTAAAK